MDTHEPYVKATREAVPDADQKIAFDKSKHLGDAVDKVRRQEHAALKECALGLWKFVRRGAARKAWESWLSWAICSRLEPVTRVVGTIRRHLWGIVNAIYFNIGGLDLYQPVEEWRLCSSSDLTARSATATRVGVTSACISSDRAPGGLPETNVRHYSAPNGRARGGKPPRGSESAELSHHQAHVEGAHLHEVASLVGLSSA